MSVFYGKSNLNFTQAGIKWNIKTIDNAANLPAVGKPGEVYVLTDKNINKLKKVATIFEGDDLVDNAINLFYQESTDSKRINYYWGWYFDFKFNSQSILLDGKGLFTYVYFWDMNVNDWVAIQVSYNFNEKFNSMEFMGKNIDIENIYPNLYNFEVDVQNIIVLEPINTPPISESMNAGHFIGDNLDFDTYYPDLYTFTENVTY